MSPHFHQEQMKELYESLQALQKQLLELKRQSGRGEVEDYTFRDSQGEVKLSELFGSKDDLIVIQNMGRGCPYCTLWADGFEGVRPHLQSRAALALVSPDQPDIQQAFAASRGWGIRLVSSHETSFKADLGFEGEMGVMPGVSTFRKEGDRIINVANDYFGPGDSYCSVWHFFDLLEGGAGDWQPQFIYE